MGMKAYAITLLSFTLMVLGGNTSLQASDAAQYRGGANHPGATSEEIDLSAANTITQAWESTPIASEVIADPLVIEDKVVLAGMGGELVVLNADTGASVWSLSLSSGIAATPAFDGGRLFVGTTGGTLHAYEFSSGTQLWQVTHGGYQVGAPVVANDQVIVAPGFGNSNLLVYDVADGSLDLNIPLTRDAQSSPAVYQDKVIVVQPDGYINCFDLDDGSNVWTVQTEGIFYGTPPSVVMDPDAGEMIVLAFPGSEDYSGTSAIAGYVGYAAYRIELDSGTSGRIVPGNAASYAASKRGGAAASDSSESERNPLALAPPELRDQLVRLSHLESMIKAVEYYEELNAEDLSLLKERLTEHMERMARFEESRSGSKRESDGTDVGDDNRASTSGRASLPGSSFDVNWPTSESARPGAVSYLSRGTQRYMAMLMREIPAITATPRNILFSLNPATFGDARWYYSASTLANPSTMASPSPLLIPNINDANGAYLLAPLGNNIAVFDASAGNTPIFEIEMPGIVYQTPVFANGRLIITDTSGTVRSYATNNAPPDAPVIATPAQDVDILNLASPHATWAPAVDDTTAQGNLTYTLRYAIDSDGDYGYTDVALGAGTLSYDWADITDDDIITFMVRATDEQGAAGPFSDPVTFSYRLDTSPPGAVSNLSVTSGALSFVVSFDPSADEAPAGDADVETYRILVEEQGSATSFTVDIGVTNNYTINGQNPATPLNDLKTYDITVSALDNRDNESPLISTSASPFDINGPDVVPPEILQATLYDEDSNGWLDTVVIEFSENIAPNPNINAYELDGQVATSLTSLVGSTLTLDFGVGVEGTGLLDLTYDAGAGDTQDLSGNLMLSVVDAQQIEVDAAPPVLLTSTIQIFDDDSNGFADRVTFDFSEILDIASLDPDDFSISDVMGLELTIIDVAIDINLYTMQLLLDNTAGSIAGTPTITVEDDGDATFVSDESGNQLETFLENEAPIVVVTPSNGSTVSPGLIDFSAAGSTDPDGDSSNMTYQWSVDFWSSTEAPTFYPSDSATLSGNNQTEASLVITEPGAYALRISVMDEDGGPSERIVSFTVSNKAPVAFAGYDSSAKIGNVVTLNATESSDPNNASMYEDIQSYAWSVLDEPTGAGSSITNPTLNTASFDTTSLLVGTYVLELSITDAGGLTDTDEIEIHVHDGSNIPATADAGPNRYVPVGEAFVLDGSFSSDDGTLSYTWTQTAGPVTLVSEPITSATTSLNPTLVGTYEFSLLVDDGTFTDTDTVTITTFNPDADYVPNLIASVPAVATRGESFSIDASASVDINASTDSELILELNFMSGPQVVQLAGGQGTSRDLLAVEAGLIHVGLRVTDGIYSSAWETFEIAVGLESDQRPDVAANNLATSVTLGDQTSFDFTTSSDAESSPLSYAIRQLGGPAPANLTDISAGLASFTPSVAGVYSFDVVANDGLQPSVPYSFSIQAVAAGQALASALATPDSQPVNLKAKTIATVASSEENASDLSYLWVQTGGPTSHIMSPTAATTSIDLPNINGTYEYELLVDNNGVRTSAGSVTVSTSGSTQSGSPVSEKAGGSSGCTLLVQTYGLPILVLLMVLGIVAARMIMVYRKRSPDQSI